MRDEVWWVLTPWLTDDMNEEIGLFFISEWGEKVTAIYKKTTFEALQRVIISFLFWLRVRDKFFGVSRTDAQSWLYWHANLNQVHCSV